MKFETLLLNSLFAACLLICVLVLGGMLTSHSRGFTNHIATQPVTHLVSRVA